MFQLIDEMIINLIKRELPASQIPANISFERPLSKWQENPPNPTINFFLFDIRERPDFRNDLPIIVRDPNGKSIKIPPPRRIDLAYLVTVWADNPSNEHQLLGDLFKWLYRLGEINQNDLPGPLKESSVPVLARIDSMDRFTQSSGFAENFGFSIRPSLCWVVTTPLEVFKPITAPTVTEREIGVSALENNHREVLSAIGGIIYFDRDKKTTVANADVLLPKEGIHLFTDQEGKFKLLGLIEGEYLLQIIPKSGKMVEKKLKVPSKSYDLIIQDS